MGKDKSLDLVAQNLEGPLAATQESLTAIHAALKGANFTGLDKKAQEQAQTILAEIEKTIQQAELDLKKNIEDSKRREEWRASRLGKLHEDITKIFENLNEKMGDPKNVLKNNKLLNAVVDVVKNICKVLKTLIESTLNNAIATGDLAKSVVNVGGVIKEMCSPTIQKRAGR